MILSFLIVALVVGLSYFLVKIFNQVERQTAMLTRAWDDIEAQLKRRRSLVPQLVEMLRAYHQQEQQLFIAVSEHTARAFSARDRISINHAERCLNDDLERIRMLAESDEELTANHSYLHIERLLADIDSQLRENCARYNDAVREYNLQIEKFPNSLLAQIMGHKTETAFDIVNRFGTQSRTELVTVY